MEVHEYIFAGLIMVAVLLAAVFLTGISPQLYSGISEIEQLKMSAQKIMTQVTLSPGHPDNWGEDINVGDDDLSSFGLAVSSIFTREAFILDPDKVQRLNKNLPENLYIRPEKVKDLLNLGFEYGIRIEFIPVLSVEARLMSSNVVEVKVSLEQGPAENAKVALGAVSIDGGSINLESLSNPSFGVTDESGRCILSLSSSNPALLIAAVEHYGIQAVMVKNVSSAAPAYFIGPYLLSPYWIPGGEAYQIFLTKRPDNKFSINYVVCSLSYEGTFRWAGGILHVYKIGAVEPNTVAIVSASGGNLVAAWKRIPADYGLLAESPLTYMLERSVKIGPSMYTLRLVIWRMSW